MTTDFVHLHTHSEYSLLDGQTKVRNIPKIAKEHGQNAVGLTDHGSLGGALKFWEAAKEAEVKHIFGCETYITPDHTVKDKDSPTWHLILLAMNETGLHNLFALSKIGWTQGFYKKPRVDHNDLRNHNEGLIALSACMASETARAIEAGDMDQAREALLRYRSIFGDRFYVELQPGNTSELNSTLANLAVDLGIPTTVTVDSHYDHCTSKAHEELLLIMQQLAGFKKSDRDFALLMKDEARKENTLMDRLNKLWPNRGLRFDHHDLYIMTRDEVVDRMNRQGFDGNELADRTLEIAERCEVVEFKTGQNYLPKVVKNLDSDEYLRALVFDGLDSLKLSDRPEYVERAEEELAVIKSKQFSDYFLIVWDLINEARNRNIYVGPGRGSAAGSLVAYALRITNIDPIKYKLLFFRFINAERNDYPDIDMDFEHTRRDEMKRYMEEKYGEKLSLSTYSEFKAKNLIASICKAFGFAESEVRSVTKHFNDLEGYENAEALQSFRAKNPEILPIAKMLEGNISGSGMHAAGVVVANRPMHEIVPIESRTDPEDKSKRVPVTAFDMHDAEKVGLIKFDFLGLSNLSIIHDTVDLVEQRHGVRVDWENLEPDDENVLAMLNEGNSIGVFQMESTAFRNLLIQQGVDSFEDMVASNALVRPGAFETVAKDYIKRKKGLEEVTYPHEDVREWLEDTYGLVIYQEQVMALSVFLGGFSWSEADRLRKIIGKKKDAAEFAPFYNKWIENAGAKIGHEEAEKLWHDFEKHSGYSFNRSHAVAYSYIGYVTAWLKFYYPTEYIYALLKNENSAMNKMTYLLEAKRMGIPILPPDVNSSEKFMSVEDIEIDGQKVGALRFGLSDIKNVGFAACDEILLKRPFISWEDWNNRITARKCNSKVVQSLMSVDAFRSIPDGPHNSEPERNYMEYLNYPIDLEHVARLGITYSNVDEYDEDERGQFIVVCAVTKSIKRTDRYVRIELEDVTGKLTCFGQMDNDLNEGEVVLALIGEKSMLSYTRVDGLSHRMENNNLNGFEKLITGKLFDKYELLYKNGFGGFDYSKSIVTPISVRRITTKTGKKMAFVYVTDGSDVKKITVFAHTWAKIENLMQPWKALCMKVKYLDDGGFTVDANGVIDADEVLQKQIERLSN